MYLLKESEWNRVSHIIDETVPFVTISMLYQRGGPGQIWVDDPHQPATVLASFPKDFYAWGDLMRPDVIQQLMQVEGSAPSTAGLREALREAWGLFTVETALYHRHSGITPLPPPVDAAYNLVRVDAGNISLLQEFWRGEYPPHTIGDFCDTDDFLRHGFAAMAVCRETGLAAAACAAISVSRERADFGLDTFPAHQKRGLGRACATLTVTQALERGLRPVWVTTTDNLASLRIAESIGFLPGERFDILAHLEIL